MIKNYSSSLLAYFQHSISNASDFWVIGLPPQIIKTNNRQTGNDKARRIFGYRAVTWGMKTWVGSHDARY